MHGITNIRSALGLWILLSVLLDPSVEGNGNLGAISLSNCPRDELYRCFDIAEPLLKNPNYVFPSNKDDISIVCKTWDDFVDCVSHYTTSCLKTDRRQQHLLTALKESVRTFDEMCGNTDYQLDYLRHAPCIKSMATDEGKCKPQLSYLVDQVSALLISNTQTCCAHHAFRECMLEAAARHCDTFANGAAVQFARDIFSKAMGFLLKYCADYMPNAGDCVIATPSPSTVPAQYDSMLFNGQNGANLASGSYEDQNPSWGPIPSLSGIQIRQPRPTPSRPESFSSTPRSYSSSQWFAPVSTYSPPFFPTGVDNTLDTPNQQGLSSSAPNWTPSFLLATLTFVISWLFIAY